MKKLLLLFILFYYCESNASEEKEEHHCSYSPKVIIDQNEGYDLNLLNNSQNSCIFIRGSFIPQDLITISNTLEDNQAIKCIHLKDISLKDRTQDDILRDFEEEKKNHPFCTRLEDYRGILVLRYKIKVLNANIENCISNFRFSHPIQCFENRSNAGLLNNIFTRRIQLTINSYLPNKGLSNNIFTRVPHLKIEGCNITDEELSFIFSHSSFDNLEFLSLKNNHLKFEKFNFNILKFRNLKILNLDNNEINGVNVIKLIESLKSLKMEEISLNHNDNIPEEAKDKIVKYLNKTEIKSIAISGKLFKNENLEVSNKKESQNCIIL